MNVLLLLLLVIAGLFALLDLVLANTSSGRRFWLLPVAVLLVVLALILQATGTL